MNTDLFQNELDNAARTSEEQAAWQALKETIRDYHYHRRGNGYQRHHLAHFDLMSIERLLPKISLV